MRSFKIVTDSSSDIVSLGSVDFASAPLKIISAEREFVDDASLDAAEMIRYFDAYKGKTQSSCPNVADWLAAFGEAEEVICITMTGALSGTYNSACLAKRGYEETYPERRVFVLDSRSTGPEVRLLVERLVEWLQAGCSFEELCERAVAYQKKTGLYFMLRSMKNLANNGRVSPIVAKIAGIVGICAIGRASTEGTLEQCHTCRGESRALETLVDCLVESGYAGGRLRISHALNEAAAERLGELIRARFANANVEIHPCGGLCSFYAEKGGLLVGYERN